MQAGQSKRRLPSLVIASISVVMTAVLALELVDLRALEPELSPAHRFRAPSNVGLRHKGRRFFGRVKSVRPRCRRNRVIILVKKRRGISDLIVARTRSRRRGYWKVRRPRAQGRFYAVVARRARRSYGHFHKCRRDRSRTLRVR